MDLTEEDGEQKRKKGSMVWDKKSKKYVRVQDDKKRVKTESGVYIAATYKTNRYAKWKERSKLAQQTDDQEENSSRGDRKRAGGFVEMIALAQEKNWIKSKTVLIYG